MARAYEDDLRRKFLAARERGDAGLKRLAARFGVSHSWAQTVVRQHKQTGQAERVRHRPGPRSRMSFEIAAYPEIQVAGEAYLTLAELQQRLLLDKDVRFSRCTVFAGHSPLAISQCELTYGDSAILADAKPGHQDHTIWRYSLCLRLDRISSRSA
jgi:transposase